MTRIVVTAGARTAITGWHRGQSDMTDDQLAATVLSAMRRQPDLVMLGNTVGPGGNVARIATLGTGWETTGAVTLDAQCGSSLLAVGQAAAHAKMTGQTVVAGGTESPSTAWPDGKRTQAAFAPKGFPDPDMTEAADRLAIDYDISREAQETYALHSHQRALDHPSHFLVGGRPDDGPRDVTKLLGRLDPVTNHPLATVTGLSAARIADAAAVVALAPETTVDSHLGVEIVDYRLVGADPALPGIAAAPAIDALLTAHRLHIHDISVIDIVEAYAAQVLAVCQRLKLDPTAVNLHGGALAHGHPWAASGVIALLTTIEQLHNAPAGTYGLIAAAVAGGMGAAVLVRNL
ncbi:thiolase family protein [Enteractinococcus coprophilus]|uniref:Probable acetyl-CoA acetyltransferase n=1 Tax=Enteractinococcus coprophilus TaxID=1027633 RepID=A0A543AMX9_9MICC|nr:acetyl-CoA C-acyltransferase [Enteractinococcus coprophilus]TQL73932.1 acetyl-CoA C-acetyltransferase [Enteractinococcus coprophilus]